MPALARRGALAAVAVLAACTCGGSPSPDVGGMSGAPEGRDAVADQEESVADTRSMIRARVAEVDGVGEDDVEFELVEEPTPHVTIFQATTPGDDPARGPEYTFGAVAGGHVAIRDAIELVAEVWEYDASRPVPAKTVARVLGFLESDIEPCHPMLGEKDLDKAHARHRDQVFLPRETTVDGRPAVQYWNRSPREPFLWMTTAVFLSGGRVELRAADAE